MDYEFTFVLPCLNEEKTLVHVINEIKNSITKYHLNAEILVADNGSSDNSRKIAAKNGVRVVIENKKGYGSNLINGTKNAKGKYCIMGDSDGSYDFTNLEKFIEGVRSGYDLIIGDRFAGGIEKKAMPLSHKIGVRFLSLVANLFFHTPVHDYHCGLRAYHRERFLALNLNQPGMEYASEMIIKAQLNHYSILEVPTILRKDLRGKGSHLRTIRDGFRHLNLILHLAFHKRKYIINPYEKEKHSI